MSDRTITVGQTADGDPYELPIEELLTGRGFVTGKSGAGKSNTGSVIVEELLEQGHPVLIVDTDGEYWGLKEAYEILHVGATEECDLQVGPEHARRLAELSLEQHVPIVLDVSGFADADAADQLVHDVAHELFVLENEVRRPFLLLVEEIHEYIPQSGSPGEVGEMLIRVGKRGRKRGLGMIGFSQRPASVDKDFITQADLLVWHRLTWENDVDVVKKVVGSDYAADVGDLANGEAFVQADWTEADVERVQFRRKHTFDAGAAPGLDDVERPELKSIGEDLAEELEEISEEQDRRQDRIAELESIIDEKDDRIEELEEEIDRLRTADETLDLMMQRMQGSGGLGEMSAKMQARLEEKNDRISELQAERDHLEEQVAEVEADRHELEEEVERLREYEERVEQAERIEEQLERARDVLGVDVQSAPPEPTGDANEELQRRVKELEAENEQLQERLADAGEPVVPTDYEDFLEDDVVQEAIQDAKDDDNTSDKYVRAVVAAILEEGEEVTYSRILEFPGVSEAGNHAGRAARALEDRRVVTIDESGDEMLIDFNFDGVREIKAEMQRRERREEIMEDL